MLCVGKKKKQKQKQRDTEKLQLEFQRWSLWLSSSGSQGNGSICNSSQWHVPLGTGSWIMPSLLDGAGQNMILTQQRNAGRMEPSNHIKETFFFLQEVQRAGILALCTLAWLTRWLWRKMEDKQVSETFPLNTKVRWVFSGCSLLRSLR